MPAATTTTSKKKTRRKAPARKPKEKTFTSDQVDQMIEKATQNATQRLQEKFEEERARREFDITNGHGEGETESGLFGGLGFQEPYHETGFEGDGESLAQTEEALNAFDIFEYCHKNFVGSGTPIKYQIKKDGTLMGEMTHPCSWVKIQKKWGEGHYTVAAKKRTDNQYIKQQTLDLGPIDQPESAAQTEINEQLERLARLQAPQGPQMDMTGIMTQMMSMFQQMQQMNHDDKKSEERDARKSENMQNQTLLTVLQGQQTSSQQMFMEMQKSNQEMMLKMQENMNGVQQKMDDKFSRLIEKMNDAGNKKDQLGTLELLKLMENSEDKGWEKMKLIMEIAEAKAAEKEEGGGDGMVGKLIGGILPLLSGAQQQQAAMLQQQRGSLPQGQRHGGNPRHQPAPQRPNPQGRAIPPQAQRASQASGLEENPQAPIGFPGMTFVEEPAVETKPSGGVMTEPLEREAEIIEPEVVEEATPTGEPDTLEGLLAEASPHQRSIAEITIPKIAEGLMSSQDPRANADQCLQMVWSQMQLGPDEVLKHFPFDFMLRIARAFQIGAEAEPWFKEYYAHIEDSAGNDVEGTSEPAEGAEQEAGIW